MSLFSADRDVLQKAWDWLTQGHRIALVTVVETWGSSPRPVGSLMVVRGDGLHMGSVSGGCVEQDLIARFRDQQIAEPVAIVDYGVSGDQAGRLGLPCGGRLELLVERIETPAALEPLVAPLTRGELVARRVCIHTGKVDLFPATVDDDFVYEHKYVQKVFGPAWQLLVIGAGHLSSFVAQIALTLDYRVTVCDPRNDYVKSWQLEGVQLTTMMPDDAVRKYVTHERSVVMTVTHDPKLDDMALLVALDSPAFYVGALGSTRSNEKRRRRLYDLGVTEQQLQRLHGPVGLAIGSRTPAEIAVAIMAEVTAIRNGMNIRREPAADAA
jgi:xanthine dehydrogenase accessory factor